MQDIIIVGGGMVGLTMAVLLAPSGMSITLLDQADTQPVWPFAEYQLRVSAITRASENILRHVGAWPRIEAMRMSPYSHMQVWDAEGNGVIHFDSEKMIEKNLGYIIENAVVVQALQDTLAQYANVSLCYQLKLQRLCVNNTHVQLECGSEKLMARLLIGADGAESWVRKQCGITSSNEPYDHQAIVATVKTEHSHQQTAWQCFMPTGPLAFLPLADKHHCSIVWSNDLAQAQKLLAHSETEFNQALTKVMGMHLGACCLVSKRISFPLIKRHAEHYISERVALIGDAIHTIHPLAGQGVNLGLLDAAVLAEVLQGKITDIALHAVLRRYERRRKGHNLLTLAMMDGFKNLFAAKKQGIVSLRNFGLRAIDKIEPLKRQMMSFAMGLAGDLPAYALNSPYS